MSGSQPTPTPPATSQAPMTLPTSPTSSVITTQAVQIYGSRGGAQVFAFLIDGNGMGKPMMSSDPDDMIDCLRAIRVLEARMTKFTTALAAANDIDQAILEDRLKL